MDDWSTWLINLAWPLVSRVLASLGFGYVSYQGIQATFDAAIQHIQSSFAGLPAEMFQMIAYAGVFDFLSISSGGIFAGLAWTYVKKLAVISQGTA